ncbi:malonate decarboxylase subunit alpha [Galbibacter sp. BG1]|uniref:acyl CoA:acetate/3-ketoacid CoA transferase n=1 Tax=Galbibacter sp. BG1 TaxID=1170699 RepID=UPI0015C01A0C|nr:malonate decarboxylase subunit alpha [Galbibacter sp. BG1]QLE02451.1 malonate decarboxylase subunit alpha [Galbibacter sp. BG1]
MKEKNFKIVSAEEAVSHIKDHDTVIFGGAGAGHAVPDKVMAALGKRFQDENAPRGLTSIHPCGIGDNDTRGLNHVALEGLIDTNIGGFWGNAPKMSELAKNHCIKGYNFPQGVLSHLMRASASGKPGIVTKVGLKTFVDPELEGGKINSITEDNLVSKIILDNEEYLFYRSFKANVAIIRGTSIDREGNLTMEEEVGFFAMLSIAQAAKTNGGIVIAQVKNINNNHVDPERVKVPGVLIDYVVQDENQEMTFISNFEPALVKRDASYVTEELNLQGLKRIVSRRAALELYKGAFVNLGYGMSDGVPIVAREEEITDQLTFMIEQGATGGIPTTGLNFGAMFNPSSIVDDGYQFDFFQGGGLDIAYLGFAQIDKKGNVNSSRFGNVLTGCGGFIDISQNAKKVVFCGSFAVKSEQEITSEGIKITNPGKFNKFIDKVEQVTFSGDYAIEKGQEVLYTTERALFRLTPKGLELIEIAPGVDLEKDILNMMDFTPIISEELKSYSKKIFLSDKLKLKDKFQ